MNTRSGGPPALFPQTILQTSKYRGKTANNMENGNPSNTTGSGDNVLSEEDQQREVDLPQMVQQQNSVIAKLTETVNLLMHRFEPAEDQINEDEFGHTQNEGDIAFDLIGEMDQGEEDENNDEESSTVSAIDALLDETNEVSDFASGLSAKVAVSFNRIPSQQPQKVVMERIKENYKVPENCNHIGVPKVNREVWIHLTSKAKQVDGGNQSSQRNLSRALVGQARLGDILYQMSASKKFSKEEITSIFVPLMDVATCIGMSMRELSMKRRSALRVSHPPVGNMCTSSIPITEFLFGDHFDTDLKSVNAAAKQMKPSSTGRGRGFVAGRFHPYGDRGGGRSSHSGTSQAESGDRSQCTSQLNFRGGPSRGRGGSHKSRGFKSRF